MSLRNRLLTLFAVFAVLPLGVLGIYQYVRAQRAVGALIESQTALLAVRAADQLDDRWALLRSDLLFLAENAETQRIYAAERAQDTTAIRTAVESADAFFRQAWEQFGPAYDRIELQSRTGAVLYRLSDAEWGGPPALRATSAIEAVEPVRELGSGMPRGRVVARPRLSVLLPEEALESRFGDDGYTLVLNRETGRILHHPRRSWVDQPAARLLGEHAAELLQEAAPEASGRISHGGSDSLRIGTWIALAAPPWTVVSSSRASEFDGPFGQMRTEALLLVLLVTLLVSVAFALATWRATRSLEALTQAADQVGRGNFAPALPPVGQDEVGRLTAAFGTMAQKVSEMMRQLEQSRQLAAIGEFAAEVSHEIRNPLTSVKLNLQRIGRALREEQSVQRAGPPLEISLREIERLDRVVRGILELGRPPEATLVPRRLEDVAREAIATIAAQAEAQAVELSARFDASNDRVVVDPELLRGAILNLLVNALEAMPHGGRLWITLESTLPANPIEDASALPLRLRIEDSGPGVPPAVREKLFQPFCTTKPSGMGLGLSTAVRAVTAQGGILRQAEPRHGTGAAFEVHLPTAPAEVYA